MHVQKQVRLDAIEFVRKKRGMTEAEATAFVKDSVSWSVKRVQWQDHEEAASATVSVRFVFETSQPLSMSLDYYVKNGWDSAELDCRLRWDGAGDGNMHLIMKDGEFLLEQAHVKAARERCFPDGWPAADVLMFMCTCVGAGGQNSPCHCAETEGCLSDDIGKLCKALEEPAA